MSHCQTVCRRRSEAAHASHWHGASDHWPGSGNLSLRVTVTERATKRCGLVVAVFATQADARAELTKPRARPGGPSRAWAGARKAWENFGFLVNFDIGSLRDMKKFGASAKGDRLDRLGLFNGGEQQMHRHPPTLHESGGQMRDCD
eukprot:3033635-Rhodomonas_salina.1